MFANQHEIKQSQMKIIIIIISIFIGTLNAQTYTLEFKVNKVWSSTDEDGSFMQGQDDITLRGC